MLNIDEAKAYQLLVNNLRAKSKAKLQSAGRGIWTGKMLEEIDVKLSQTDSGDFSIDMYGNLYMMFMDEGVNGAGSHKTKSGKLDNRFKGNREVVKGSPYSYTDKKPQVEALTPWANAHGISPYAVVNSIYRKGLKPIHFLEAVLDEELDQFSEYLAEVQADAILNDFGDE